MLRTLRDTPMANAEAQRILVYRLGSLGDFTVALPALHGIRERFPHAAIDLLTNIPVSTQAPAAAQVLNHTGLIDDYLAYPLGTRSPRILARLLRQLRARRYDLLVNLSQPRGRRAEFRDAAFFRFAGIHHQTGIIDVPGGPHPKELEPGRRWESIASVLARRVGTLANVDILDPSRWNLHLTGQEQAEAANLLQGVPASAGFFVVNAGGKSQTQHWPRDNWRALASLLETDLGNHAAVIVGGPGDAEALQEGFAEWPGGSLDLCGCCTPRVSAAIMASARLFIGHDSGPLHLAEAAGIPVIGIYCARSKPGLWFPVGPQHHALYEQVPCFGCELDRCEVYNTKCIRAISPEAVAEAVRSVISSPASR